MMPTTGIQMRKVMTMILSYEAIRASEAVGLEVIYLTQFRGYIQTPSSLAPQHSRTFCHCVTLVTPTMGQGKGHDQGQHVIFLHPQHSHEDTTDTDSTIIFRGRCGRNLQNHNNTNNNRVQKLGREPIIFLPDEFIYDSSDYTSSSKSSDESEIYPNSSETSTSSFSSSSPPPPSSSSSVSLLHCVSTSGDTITRKGITRISAKLNVSFSFHRTKPYQVQQQDGSGRDRGPRWNCSFQEWPDLHLHFPCDLTTQCEGGEDELRCGYYSEECGLGQVTVADKCFFLLDRVYYHIYRAIYECERRGPRGSTVASLESNRQWRTLSDPLQRGGHLQTDRYFWIGLQPRVLVKDFLTEEVYIENMYLYTWMWLTGSVAYNLESAFDLATTGARLHLPPEEQSRKPYIQTTVYSNVHVFVGVESAQGILCSRPRKQQHPANNNNKITISAGFNTTSSTHAPLVTCRLGHVTHAILACDADSFCSGRIIERGGHGRMLHVTLCQGSGVAVKVPYFKCSLGGDRHVPFSVVCDWNQDCLDYSDEAFCHFPPCGQKNTFDCGGGQCISTDHVCDQIIHCKSKLDENSQCNNFFKTPGFLRFNVTESPAVVNFDRTGTFSLVPLAKNVSRCPDSHYQCPGDGYCLPIYTRCNEVNDCPGHEDEQECERYTCEGLYRCRGKKKICMHVQHLCDGWPQCPQEDDELMCKLAELCPEKCICYGKKFSDKLVFKTDTVPVIRYLEGRGSGFMVDTVQSETMLIYLGAGECGWTNVSKMHLPNLLMLDISDNDIRYVLADVILHLQNLKALDLSGNPLSRGFGGLSRHNLFESLLLLNLSRISSDLSQIRALSEWVPQLEMIDFSHSALTSLRGLEYFTKLKSLNLQGCVISDFSYDFMKEMNALQHVFAEHFKFCCPAVLPEEFVGKCSAPVDEISSCNNLLKAGSYRAALAMFALAALLGNSCSLVYRLWFSPAKRKVGYAVFVLHLCVSDFLMGVYLAIIGLADHLFAGSYLWKESFWKGSTACSMSGFISLLSCEVSSFLICLISLDRFLVIRFPFSRLHFRTTSAHVACTVSWGLGLTLASIPLLPVTSHWAFYSQTGICIPLPITRADFPGRHYSFGVMIVFNLALFLLIAISQTLIYWTIRASAMTDDGSRLKDKDSARSKEATIARRLLVIAMSDFVCWFPIGVCGILANLNVRIPGEVNIAMAIFVLPFNSALNPFLYTYTIVREKQHKQKGAKLQTLIATQIKTTLGAMNH